MTPDLTNTKASFGAVVLAPDFVLVTVQPVAVIIIVSNNVDCCTTTSLRRGLDRADQFGAGSVVAQDPRWKTLLSEMILADQQ